MGPSMLSFLWGVSLLSLAPSPLVMYNHFIDLRKKGPTSQRVKGPKRKRLACNLCYCFSNTTSHEAKRIKHKF